MTFIPSLCFFSMFLHFLQDFPVWFSIQSPPSLSTASSNNIIESILAVFSLVQQPHVSQTIIPFGNLRKSPWHSGHFFKDPNFITPLSSRYCSFAVRDTSLVQCISNSSLTGQNIPISLPDLKLEPDGSIPTCQYICVTSI